MSQVTTINENTLNIHRHVLLHNSPGDLSISKDFAGTIFSNVLDFNYYAHPNTILYVYGDIDKLLPQLNMSKIDQMNIIREHSTFSEPDQYGFRMISVDQLPVNMHNVGVFYPMFFDEQDMNFYKSITDEHEFQSLTESNKPGVSLRKGIYLSDVEKEEDRIKFNLLRCSTNLSGPTDNFRSTDKYIIDKVNAAQAQYFDVAVNLNHVLAQTFHNSVDLARKAKISQHSDKTNDMPDNAIMAFCTFYKDFYNSEFHDELLNIDIKRSDEDHFDFRYKKNTTILTKLRFKLKDDVTDEKYVKNFDITLYPNSVFLMSLTTNRLYTHEIVPSNLPADKIPTRLGYIIRCSETQAYYDTTTNDTFIPNEHGEYAPLEERTAECIEELKKIYFTENSTSQLMNYRNIFFFSLNNGDYQKPIL